ncbi:MULTISPECIES: S1C family serine protease [unclassified Adlercreutzia]|uniref:S1C family serine protease n=1 Tax=unclassified Adlercreutzia TaxID=2636013 RepID=UPI0013EA9EBE|nr:MULTISPECIES: trypsin-like peptidase domain-containing protein [unclassified Adlercreutzia]
MTDASNTPSGGGYPSQPNPAGQQGYPGAPSAQPAPRHSAYHSAYQSSYPQGGASHAAPAGTPGASGGMGAGFPGGAPHEAQRKKGSAGKTFVVAFAGALLACVLAFGVAGVVGLMNDGGGASGGTSLGASTSSPVAAGEADATLPEAVAAKCLPSVAAIDVYASAASSALPFGFGTGQGQGTGELVQSSLGSGVVLTADGYIVTNYHVVEGGEAYKVTVGGETYDAELVGSDPSSDVAVLKAKGASGLTAIEIGDSDNLTIGEWVMSIGSPFGLEQSVATGIVSATSRSQIMEPSTDMYGNSTGEYTIYPNMIQTDAAINPGNSGGALVDAEGKLIGINTLITSYSGNYSGVGFAIPVNYAISLAQQIIDGKTPTHAQLGVSMTTVNPSIAKRYGLAVDEGAYVSAVSAGSGAAEAGIEAGDIITSFDGKAVASASDLMLDVRAKNPGDVVTVTVNRDGATKDLQVTLGSDESSMSALQQQGGNLLDMLRGDSGSGSGDAA